MKPIKLTKDRQGESFYPATTTDAVVHPEQRKTLTEIISETIPTTITNGTGTNSSLQVNAYNCEASGTNSIATGVKSIASGNYSVALGRFTEASGRGSVALGGYAKGFTFTGAAGTTKYSTNITDQFLPLIVSGIRFYPTTETNDGEFWAVVNTEKIDNVVYVTLDHTISADSSITNKTLYSLLNAAIGNSAIALGGVVKGANSVCAGGVNLVNGGQSVALGSSNQNSGSYSFSAGYNNIADGSAALALGHSNKAVGGQAIAMGYGNEAAQSIAIAIGNKNTVPKQSAIGIGVMNDSIGSSSVAIGYKNKAHHHGTVTLGGYTTATNQGEVAVGIGNISHSGTRFSVGGGNELLYYDETTNKNLFEIMSNGDIWIGNYNEGKKLWDVATETSPLILENVHPDTIFFDITNITPIEYDGEETFPDEYTVSYISLSDFEANIGLSWSEIRNKKMIQYTNASQSILYNIIGYNDNEILSECYSYLTESRTLGFVLLDNEIVAVLQHTIQLISTKDIIEETQLSENVQTKLNNLINIYLIESDIFQLPEIGDYIQRFPAYGLGYLKDYLDDDFGDSNVLGKQIVARIKKFNGDSFSVSVPQAYKSGDTYYFIIIIYGDTNIKYTCSYVANETTINITTSEL